MRWFRSHVDLPLQAGITVALPDASRQHLGKVLRLREGDAVTLFNGDGHDYPARLTGAGPSLSAQVLSRDEPPAREAQLRITLVQALARGEKMDWILQKATELGVARFVPVSSQRSEVRLDGERAAKRVAHWRQVVISACEQCGRATIPDVTAPRPLLSEAENRAGPAGLRLVLDPDGDLTLADLGGHAATPITLAIGPEGGLDRVEVDHLQRHGWQRLRLRGPILRTETAGLATVAALLALNGEL